MEIEIGEPRRVPKQIVNPEFLILTPKNIVWFRKETSWSREEMLNLNLQGRQHGGLLFAFTPVQDFRNSSGSLAMFMAMAARS